MTTTENRTDPGEPLKWLRDLAANPPDDGCVLWPFGMHPAGYGHIRYQGEAQYASRVALILHSGENPEDLSACHHCGNRRCCNPLHLYWGTHADNMADKARHGTLPLGERVHSSKLTAGQVLRIVADPRSTRNIAGDYGVNASSVSAIKTGRFWSHVTGINRCTEQPEARVPRGTQKQLSLF